MDTLTITIYQASEGGFMYDIYDCEANEVGEIESLDGGHCTSDNIKDALQMANSQAQDLIRRKQYKIKD